MYRKLLARTGEVLLGNGLCRLMLLGFELAFAARLGTEAFGEWSIVFSILVFGTTAALLGLDYGLLRFLAIYQEEQDTGRQRALVRVTLLTGGGLGLAACLAMSFGSEWIAAHVYRNPRLATPLLLIGIVLPLETLNLAISSILRGYRRFRDNVVVSAFIRNAVLIGGMPLLYLWGFGVVPALWLLIAGSACACGYGLWRLNRLGVLTGRVTVPLWPIFRETTVYSFPIFLWNFFRAGTLSVFLASVFLSSADMGVFSLMLRMMVVFFLQRAVNVTAPVEFARLSYQGATDELRRLYCSISYTLMICASLLAIPLAVDPRQLFSLVGPDFADHALLFLPLLAAQVLNVGTGPIGHLLIYVGGNWTVLRLAVLVSIVQVATFTLLIPKYGLPGAVAAESIVVVFFTITRQIAAWRKASVHSVDGVTLTLMLFGVVCCLAGWLASGSTDSIVRYALSAMGSLLLYVTLLGIGSRVLFPQVEFFQSARRILHRKLGRENRNKRMPSGEVESAPGVPIPRPHLPGTTSAHDARLQSPLSLGDGLSESRESPSAV